MRLLKKQQLAAKEHLDKRVFLEGAAGTGKTTAAIERVKQLIRDGAPAGSILIIVPQATLAAPYHEALKRARVEGAGSVRAATLGGLAVEMLDLFWPLIAEEVGFARPTQRPHFLSLELAQYYMTRFIQPEIERGDLFNSVHIQRNRLYTQILDNLNKAALVGFPHDQIGERLKAAWAGDVEQAAIYDDAQRTADLFRDLCRQYNLLDFSLQVILFVQFLWRMEHPRRYLTRRYRHLIVDNVEEDNPAAHDLIADWLPECDSALLIYDLEGGFRRFLGADPDDGYRLKALCEVQIELDNDRVMSDEVAVFRYELGRSFGRRVPAEKPNAADARDAIRFADCRYLPQMLDWTADNVRRLIVDEGVSPKEIVILSALLPDALRFALQSRLTERGIVSRTHRPSRALREEPAARALIALAKLAHPDWGIAAEKYDTIFALSAAIRDLDLARARLLVETVYKDNQLTPFAEIADPEIQNRVTFELGGRYERLRAWLARYQAGDPQPLDHFFSAIFGEVLAQPGFGFHRSPDAAAATANLIDSAREFRQTVSRIEPDLAAAPEYVKMVDQGVIANLYVRDRDPKLKDAVLIAPAYAFLMSNTPVDYQFWLNVGSSSWGQRLYQPLTHPYVLSRGWKPGRIWTDADEYATDQETVYRIVSGLARRCRKRVYIGFSEIGEQGMEQRGAVLTAVQGMLRRLSKAEAGV
jgi:hypothetical protein